jgi:Xaa-Pro aminopeptidase
MGATAGAAPTSVYLDRTERARKLMAEQGVDVLLLSVGHDLPYLTGYLAMPLERLTMLVLPRDGEATLVVPRLEAPRVVEQPGVFVVRPWNETEDPVAIVAALAGRPATAAVGDQLWARFLVDLLPLLPATAFRRAVEVVGPLRERKDATEIAALAAAAAAADRVAAQLQGGDVPLLGRTEAQVSADLSQRLVAEGHDKVNFAIVATAGNAASPHHHAGPRVIERGDIVLCDFGGTMDGYCSDITRCVHLGPPPVDVTEAYDVLRAAQRAGVEAGVVGVPCEEVDRVARAIIADAGFGEYFVHRTGHGIGMEEHEDPYMVQGNGAPLEPGHAYSVEPGIYLPGRWGMRLEDIVVATPEGPQPLNHADHALVVLDV